MDVDRIPFDVHTAVPGRRVAGVCDGTAGGGGGAGKAQAGRGTGLKRFLGGRFCRLTDLPDWKLSLVGPPLVDGPFHNVYFVPGVYSSRSVGDRMASHSAAADVAHVAKHPAA
jgi:hypothetical protein